MLCASISLYSLVWILSNVREPVHYTEHRLVQFKIPGQQKSVYLEHHLHIHMEQQVDMMLVCEMVSV
jgi:hypothetical protein